MVYASWGIQNHALAFKVNSIGAGGQALYLIQVFLFRLAVKLMSGVDQGQLIAFNHR